MDGKPDRDNSLDQGNFADEWKRANRVGRFALLTRTGAHDLTSCDLICPNLEADQRVRSECMGDGNIRGITPLRDQDAANSRHVVSRIEGMPTAADIGLEPAGKIARRPRLWCSDVAEIAGAITRRNVHAAAQGDGEMRVVAAHALAFIENFPRRHGGASVLIAESDMAVH